jgi:hypothetical protein
MWGTQSHDGVAMDARVVPPGDEGVGGSWVGGWVGEVNLVQEA